VDFKALSVAGWLLGLALGGFFDGILLHQILQWHHLLSGLESARADLRLLVLTDGVFHAMTYLIAVGGLWALWRAWGTASAAGAGNVRAKSILLGFGIWHVVDALVSHWLLGIHRVRMDVDNPLFWDVAWLVIFGIGPIAAGLSVMRRSTELHLPPLALAIGVTLMAVWSAQPPPTVASTLAVFAPGLGADQVMAAIVEVGGTLVWTNAEESVWALRLPDHVSPLNLYGKGALFVGGGPVSTGCLDWIV
jgi:uncharacterized membrane protein